MIFEDKTKDILNKNSKYIQPINHLANKLTHHWPGSCINTARQNIELGRHEKMHITPIHYTSTSNPGPTPPIFMVEHMGVSIFVLSWAYGSMEDHISTRVCAIAKGGVVTLVNTKSISSNSDRGKALCEVLGGSLRTDLTNYPINPVRYNVGGGDYPFSDGLQLRLTKGNYTEVIRHGKDYKVRSNRKVTIKVNKLLDDYMESARAMKLLIQYRGTNWQERENLYAKYAKTYLQLDNRPSPIAPKASPMGLIQHYRDLITRDDNLYGVTVDSDTGTIIPTKNLSLTNTMLDHIKKGDAAPMAYLMLELSDAEERVRTSLRAVLGGYYIEEV